MNKLKRHFDITITLLAPLHIGTGRELLRGYDYVPHRGRTWFLDTEAMLDAFVDEHGNFDERILGRPAEELLDDGDFREDNPIMQYSIAGRPRSTQEGAVLREQIKDVFGRPYVPGSSLKGALRTVLAWHGYQTNPNAKLKVDAIRGSRSWAGQEIERTVLGRDPNHDLLRAIHVADSAPIAATALQLVNAQVVTGGDKYGSPIECEALMGNKAWDNPVIRTTLTLDEILRTDAYEQHLRLGARRTWLDDLPKIARAWAAERLAFERVWFAERNYMRIAQFYRDMETLLTGGKFGKNRFFLQLGWGGGWGSKTIGLPLQQDDREWQRLLDDRRLSPARMRRGRGDAFPKSRRVMMINDQPMAPFGWCAVEMKERKS